MDTEKRKSLIIAGVLCLVLGLFITNAAQSYPDDLKIGVVNVKSVLSSSVTVNEIKKEKINSQKELNSLFVKAKEELSKEKNPTKRKEIEKKYLKMVENKKKLSAETTGKKLAMINNNILFNIKTQAKANNFDLVLTKEVVLFGGTDITNKIIQNVK